MNILFGSNVGCGRLELIMKTMGKSMPSEGGKHLLK